MVQRRRWGIGCFQTILLERLWRRSPGLTGPQRRGLLRSGVWWLEGLLVTLYMAMPAVGAVMVTTPVRVSLTLWLVVGLSAMVGRVLVGHVICRGHVGIWQGPGQPAQSGPGLGRRVPV